MSIEGNKGQKRTHWIHFSANKFQHYYAWKPVFIENTTTMIDTKTISPENQKQMQYLSALLRETRINAGYTQEQVAQEIKLSRNSISKIENMGFFRIQHLFLLADFYEIPVSELFYGD